MGKRVTPPRGKQSQLDAIQARYRWTMRGIYDHPRETWSQRIRDALETLAREKAAVGAPPEAAPDAEDPGA